MEPTLEIRLAEQLDTARKALQAGKAKMAAKLQEFQKTKGSLREEIEALKAELVEAKKLLLTSAQVGMSHDDSAIEAVARTCGAFLKEKE